MDLMIGYRRRASGYSGSIMRRINISTVSGELLVVAGLNGVGKSTLLRTMAGLQKQVDGKIFLCGKSIFDYSRNELARTISFVSTEPVNVPYLKVFDLAAMGRYPHTGRMGRLSMEDKFRVLDALELVGLRAMAFRNVDMLSDGERQRVMIARTLVQDTPIVLLDEPTAYLDIPNKYEILALLQRLAHQQNKTIIYSTHDLSLAMRTADKVWLLSNSYIYEGAPEDHDIQTAVQELFAGSHLDFNRITGEITPETHLYGEVAVFTKNDPGRIRNAIARLGYHCILNSKTPVDNLPNITITIRKSTTEITYAFNSEEMQFSSFYELGSYLRKNPPPVPASTLQSETAENTKSNVDRKPKTPRPPKAAPKTEPEKETKLETVTPDELQETQEMELL